MLRLASMTTVVVAAAVLAAAIAETASAACRPTRPNGHVPAGASSTLFGNGRLTAAYGEIYATARTSNRGGTISEKFPWFGASDLVGDLRITGKRLDRVSRRPLRARINPGWVESAPDMRFWAAGITFPTAGCWRITGAVGDVRLSFVVLVRR
jgi:hypothetical protein